ncbi:MAG: hypothetical protein OEZ22_11465 [Spirochaetia bacterium]|nr:hypothetical protein [Spirochaetia bacterium]
MPKNHNKSWSNADLKKLKSLANREESTQKIAKGLGRTEAAIYKKASEENISLKLKDK